MGRRSYIAVAIAALAAVGCQPAVVLTELIGETTLEGNSKGGALNSFPQFSNFTGVDWNKNQEFKSNSVAKEQLRSVRLESLEVKILSPMDQGFEFLDSLTFLAKSADAETVIAEKVGIAELGLGAPNPTLKLDAKGVELKEHIGASSMSLIVRAKGRIPPRDTRLQARAVIRAELRVF